MALDFSLKGTSFEKKEEPSPSTLDFSLKGTSFYKEPAVEEESTSGIEAGITGFVKELIPSTGAFAVGTRTGMAAAAATPPVLPVVGPLAKPVVGGAVGLVAGLLAAFGLSEGQEAVLEKVAPETLARAKQAEKEHPYAYHAGSLASVVPASGLGVKALKELADIEIKKGTKLGIGKATAGFAGLGAGFETGMELATTGEVDPVKVAMSAAAFPVTLGNTKLGGKLAGIKEPIPTPTPEPTPETPPVKSSVDTTLEQWQNELAVEQATPETIRPQEQPITPPEGVKPTEGIPAPQGDVETRLKALEKESDYYSNPPNDYDPTDTIKTINRINKELKTETDEDVRAMLYIVRDQAKEVLEGDLHPSVVEETGLDIRRTGNYIDVVEVPENLRRQGIGTKIVENLETDMKAEGYKSAFLLAKEESIPFWEKQGYQIDPSHVREKGENVPMSKRFRGEQQKKLPAPQEEVAEGLKPDVRPVTLDDTTPPKYLYHGTRADVQSLVNENGDLVLLPSKNFGGKTTSVSLTHNEDFAKDYATRIKGGGPYGFDFYKSKLIQLESEALPEGISRESGEEWAFNTDKPIIIPKGKFKIIEHPLSKDRGSKFKENPEYTWKEYLNDNYSSREIDSMDQGDYERVSNDYMDSVWSEEDKIKFEKEYKEKETLKKSEILKLKDVVDRRSSGQYQEPAVEWNTKVSDTSGKTPLAKVNTKDEISSVKKPELPVKEQKIPSIYDVVDEADFHAKGKQVLKEQGPEAAREFADNYIRARGTDPVLVQQNVNQFISKEIQQHGATVEAASDIIEKSANSILADSRKADIYSQSLVDRIPELGIRDRMTRALEKERRYDELYTDKKKQELLYGTGKKNAAGYPDRGYVGRLEGMKSNLAKGKIPKGHTGESYARAIEKFEIVVNRLEKLPSEEFAIPILKEVETRLNKIGTEAKQAGLIESLRDNYVPHVLDWSKFKGTKQEQLDFMQKIQEKLATAPKDSKIIRDFTQQRKFEFLRELEKLLYEVGGTDHGVVVHTDIAKIVNAYEKAMQTAKIQKSMIDYLKINKDVHGKPWIMEDNLAAKQARYVSFEGKGARPLQNYRVHPDLVDAMNFMFREKDPGVIVRGLGAVSHLTKALNTVGSLFHAKSLIEAGGLTSPSLMVKELFTAGSGTRAALKALKSGDDPLIDLLIREGGLMVKVEDIQRTIVPEMGQFLDNAATKFSKVLKGPNVKLVQHITDPLDKVVLQKLNAFTWDFMHAGQKVNVAKHLFNKMKLNNPDIPDAVLAKEVGDYVNSTFGGLNWLQVANSVQNKYLRALAQKTMNTSGREWAQIVMFAPDWTVSTLRAFTNALPKELSKPKNWHLLEGAKGVFNPRTKNDLARRYVVTTALAWLTILNAINMMLSDKPIWENKDPTRVEFKDGTSMQAAKHSMEAAHWMMNPDKTLGNKLGFFPKALFVGATGIAYPSPDAPKLKDTSTLGRAKAIALLGAPFQVSSAVQAPEGEALKRAGLSTMGFPVYGVSKEKLKEAQRKGRQEAKERKLKRMLEEH